MQNSELPMLINCYVQHSDSEQYCTLQRIILKRKPKNLNILSTETKKSFTLTGCTRPMRIAAWVTCSVDRVTNLVVVVAVALLLTVHSPPSERTFYKGQQSTTKQRDLRKVQNSQNVIVSYKLYFTPVNSLFIYSSRWWTSSLQYVFCVHKD